MVVRADHLVGEAQIADEVEGRRFDREEAVRAGFEGAAVHPLGVDDAAHTTARFEEGRADAALG